MNWLERTRARWLAYAAVTLFLIGAVVMLGIASHLFLATYYPPHLAALLTAAGFIFMALITLTIINVISMRRQRPNTRQSQSSGQDIETLLAATLSPELGDWIRRNPGSAVAAGLIAGVAAGYSETVRRVLQDFYNRYTELDNTENS